MELTAILQVVRRHVRLIVACTLISTATALVVSLAMSPTYQASTKLLIGPALSANVTDPNQLQSAQQLAQTYAEAIQTQTIARLVIDQLGLPQSAPELLHQISVQVDQNAPIITVTLTEPDPDSAAQIANAVAQQIIAQSAQIQGRDAALQKLISDQVTTIQGQIAATSRQIAELPAPTTPADQAQLSSLNQLLVSQQATLAGLLETQANSPGDLVTIIDKATVPTDKASPRVSVNVALGLAFGLLIGLVLSFAADSLDDTFKSPEELEDTLHRPLVGTVGRLPVGAQRSGIYALVMLLYPRSAAAEAFRTLRTNLEFADVDSGLRTLLITSPVAGDGKSTVAANLALAFAQAGRRTILVDGDLRKPTIHELFDLTNTYGLTSLIRSEVIELAQVLRAVDEPNLRIITSGPLPPNPAELLGSNRMHAIVDRVKAEADIVIFDSPPSIAVTDAAVLGSLTDGSVLVVAANRTRRGMVRQADEAITRVGGRIVGVVMNQVGGRETSGYADVYPQAESERMAKDLGSMARPTP